MANLPAVLLRHLRVFMAVAEEGQFQRAAARLNIDQSAVSRRIRDLEVELGVALFERRPAGARLTAAGESLRADLNGVVAQLEAAAERARRAMSGRAGVLRIGFIEMVARDAMMSRTLAAFEADYPDVELKLLPMLPAAQIAALKAGEIDIGFLLRPSDSLPELDCRDFVVHDLVLALPRAHGLARKAKLVLADLKDERFLWPGHVAAPLVADRLMEAFRRARVMPRIVMEVNTSETMLSVVAAGMGIGFIDSTQRGHEPDNVVLKKVSDFSLPLVLQLAWNPANRSPLLPAFVEVAMATTKNRRDVGRRISAA